MLSEVDAVDVITPRRSVTRWNWCEYRKQDSAISVAKSAKFGSSRARPRLD